ncbi:sensor histidine kinase [Limosilactobacillus fermentum]|nr:HAMP domain-containing sensor histidine kinase [Limosilactobacillus fermentum]
MASANELMKIAAAMGIVSLLLFTLVLIALSNRAIQPIIEAEKRQKEFITNAGHELKTPLAIIETNTELSEMISGETEWTTSNKQQVARLTRLINNLISLARFDEQPEMTIATIDASAAVQRAADSFEAMITHEGKGFSTNIAPGVKVRADENYFYELCNILLDNANKYCDDGGKVSVLLRENKTTRAVTLEVGNTYAEGKEIDYTKFFNRFYRDDTSHNSKKRGYGIGLSMAQTLVHAFKGKISARYKNQTLYFTIRLKMTK